MEHPVDALSPVYAVSEYDQFRTIAATIVAAILAAPAPARAFTPGELLVGHSPGTVANLLISNAVQLEVVLPVITERINSVGTRARPMNPTVKRIENNF